MGKINVLSFEIANLIAAGEVVERPSSVLKELIENSIDAGATEITAEIKRGGVALIRVTDNGCGIEKDDLPVSLKRHATSKIQQRDDLDNIITLGFRGEALAAISSVSQVTIITKTKNSDTGYMLTSEGGQIIDISEVGASDGTTVVVENLFYNVPARRKFLKKDSTEAMNVAALVEKVALSRPDISIQLLVDGNEKFKTPGDSKLINTIRAIYGRDHASKMIPIDGIADGIKVSGYIGRSDNVRKNRNLENVFINGRYVKSLTAQAAIEKAYTSFIASEHFPCCTVLIEMNPNIVDVNVHPAKLEVKFADERKVFEAIYYTVKSALEESEYRPEMQLGAKRSDYNPESAFVPIGADTKGMQVSFDVENKPSKSYENFSAGYRGCISDSGNERKDYKPSFAPSSSYAASSERASFYVKSEPKIDFFNNGNYRSSVDSMSAKESVDLLAKYRDAAPKIDENANAEIIKETPKNENENNVVKPLYKYVGEAFNCYVIIEYDNELLIIDKHAAHERIIFEDLKRGRNKDGRIATQELLLPLTVILTPDELSYAEELRQDFEKLGYVFTVNEKSIDITAVPNSISVSDAEGVFHSVLSDVIEGKGTPSYAEEIRLEKALYSIACKAAIKGGRAYDRSIIDWLIEKVLALPDITVCPHGRPIAYKLKKTELDRQFDRIK